MKKLIFLGVALISMSFMSAQKVSEKEVPAAVKAVLKTNYPNAKDLKWEKERRNFEAEFEIGKTDYSVLINPAGRILETEMEIPKDELPGSVFGYIMKNYPGDKIKEATKITNRNHVVRYEVEVEDYDLIFNNEGKFLRRTKN